MSKKYIKFLWVSLICFIAIGLIINTIVVVCNKNKEIPQAEIDSLYAQEQLVSKDFANITKFDDAQVEIGDRKAIVTFTEKNCKIEAIYDENLELVSSALIKNKEIRVGLSYFVSVVIPLIVWSLMFCFIELVKIEKSKEENAND